MRGNVCGRTTWRDCWLQDENAPWTFEVLLDEQRGGRWVYRRDPNVSCRLDDVGARRNGIPFLRPEIVLLYKSKRPTATDELDFATVAPRLTESASSRLRAALRTSAPGHPWLERLAER